jgi:hypothetical protein
MKALSAADSAASPATKITIPYYSAAAGAGEAGPPFGKGRYKVWALAAIALLALWSMSAASASLRWSSGRFLLAATASEDLDAPLLDDLDSLVRSLPPTPLPSSSPFAYCQLLAAWSRLYAQCLV